MRRYVVCGRACADLRVCASILTRMHLQVGVQTVMIDEITEQMNAADEALVNMNRKLRDILKQAGGGTGVCVCVRARALTYACECVNVRVNARMRQHVRACLRVRVCVHVCCVYVCALILACTHQE